MINREKIPIVDDTHAYKYLGTKAISSKLGGLEATFDKTWKMADFVEMSSLTPMQKLHALRTYILPKLMHLLENNPLSVAFYSIFPRLIKLTKKNGTVQQTNGQ